MFTRIWNTTLGSKVFSEVSEEDLRTFYTKAKILASRTKENYIPMLDTDLYMNQYDLLTSLASPDGFTIIEDTFTADRTIFWGDDSPEFALEIINLFGLSGDYVGLTDRTTFSLIASDESGGATAHNLYLSTESTTFNYVKIVRLGVTSYSRIVYPATNTLATTVTVRGLSFTPGAEQIEFSIVTDP